MITFQFGEYLSGKCVEVVCDDRLVAVISPAGENQIVIHRRVPCMISNPVMNHPKIPLLIQFSEQSDAPGPVSACCKAPLKVEGSREGTNWYVCTACGKPSDPAASNAQESVS